MSTTVADLRAKISVDGAEKAKSDLKGVGDSAESAKGHLGGIGGVMGGVKDAFLGGIGAIAGAMTGLGIINTVGDAVGFLKDQVVDLFQEAESHQAAMAQTAAVIKSTGDASGLSAGQVGDLADHLAQLTGISDDTIQSAENILLTFTNINKNVFPQTTGLVLDMATAMHEDFNSAAIQIGKALQDPIQGVTALRRVGVQLDDEQTKMVKHFVDTGQSAKAQQIIIGELTKELGGSAQAYGKTLPGQMAILNVKFDQMKEKIGLAVLPILQTLIDKYLMPAADWLGKQLPAAITILTNFLDTQFVPAVNAVVNSPVVTTIEGWAKSFATTLTDSAKTATGALGDKGVAGAGNTAKNSLKNLKDQAQGTAGTIDGKGGLADHVNAGTTSILGLAGAIDAPDTPAKPHLNPAMDRYRQHLIQLNGAQDTANKKVQQSTPVLSGIADLWQHAGDAIGQFGNDINVRLPGAMPQIQRFGDFLGDVFGPKGALPGLQTTWDGFWGTLSAPVKTAFGFVHDSVNIGLDVLSGDWDKAGADAQKGVQHLSDNVKDGLKNVGKFLLGPFQAGLGGILSAVENFPALFDKQWQQTINDISNWVNTHVPHFNIGIEAQPPGQKKASGGPVSGAFIGAEQGPELLVTPGVYYSPPGGYVYNAQQTKSILSGGNGGASLPMQMRGGNTYVTNVYPQQASINAADLARIQRRRELLTGMGVN